MDSSATGFRGRIECAAPALKDLLPDLSRDEQLRLENGGQVAGRRHKHKGRRRIIKQDELMSMAVRTEGYAYYIYTLPSPSPLPFFATWPPSHMHTTF